MLLHFAEKTIFHELLSPGGPPHNVGVHTGLIHIHTGGNRGNILGLHSVASALGAVLTTWLQLKSTPW